MFKPSKAIEVKEIPHDYMILEKYDGVRCIFYNGEVFTKSMKSFPNKDIVSLVTHGLNQALKFHGLTPNNVTLEGEIVFKESNLQRTSSICRTINKKVFGCDFHLYLFDCYFNDVPNLPFRRLEDRPNFKQGMDRYGWLHALAFSCKHGFVRVANECIKVAAIKKSQLHDGLILRHPDGAYYPTKEVPRPLLKYKFVSTKDVKVVEVLPMIHKDGSFTGKAGAFVVELLGGETFKVALGITKLQREEVWSNQSYYVGQTVEIQHRGLSEGGIPLQGIWKGKIVESNE